MNASSVSARPRALFERSMSTWAAGQSFHATGPEQAGRF